jgi:hypothetical protein
VPLIFPRDLREGFFSQLDILEKGLNHEMTEQEISLSIGGIGYIRLNQIKRNKLE